MSIIESTAPTSWKQTSPISRPWIFASASARTVKIFRESALALPDSPEFSISFFISENGLCACEWECPPECECSPSQECPPAREWQCPCPPHSRRASPPSSESKTTRARVPHTPSLLSRENSSLHPPIPMVLSRLSSSAGSAPASTSAPRFMSPLMPAKQS